MMLLMLLHPIEVARQLTLLEFTRFMQIQDSELVGGAWRDIARRQDAPNVWRMVEASNAFSKWTATVICAEPGASQTTPRRSASPSCASRTGI